MRYIKSLLATVVLIVCYQFAFAQPSIYKMKAKVSNANRVQGTGDTVMIITPTHAGVRFSSDSNLVSARQWLADRLELRQGTDALNEEGASTKAGDALEVTRLHQYYKGIKVEHGVVINTSRNSKVAMMQMEFYSIPDDFKTTPVVSESEALKKAMQFTGASNFVWENYTGTDPKYTLPKGELVIVRTYENDSSVCLAWKFKISANKPIVLSYIYVNAWTGKIVLDDPLIKHSNVTGLANTLYSGVQSIVTDNGGTTPGKPYKLKQTRNGHLIRTLNYKRRDYKIAGSDELADEFSDDDNLWTSLEYANPEKDIAALDAHFNAQIVSDYWKQVHQRNSWDDKNSEILIYVHVNEDGAPMDNAFWNGSNLHLGDGDPLNSGGNPPATSLDDIGHELGHGITSSTSNLVYQWESGALNEGFSDIWAACVTNFAKVHYPSLSSELTWRLFEKSGRPTADTPGFRDMKDPHIFGQPKVYREPSYFAYADYQTCPVPDEDLNDHCGVHRNSGVINRWFYLLTEGDTGTDPLGNSYSISGIGFGESQKIAYLATLNLPPNSTFSTARMVTSNVAATLYGTSSTQLQVVKSAWKAVGVDSNVYDMSNVPVFTTNNFTGIAVGKDGYVWAGTNYNGLYTWNGSAWAKRSEITNVRINDIKADKAGGIWVAQSGLAGGSAATAGGVNYFPTPTATPSFYTVSTQTNVPSRNARCMFVDTSRMNDGPNPKVWVATMSYLLNGNSTSGMLGQGLYSTPRYFRAVSEGLNIASNTAGTLTVGGNKNQIWTFAQANNGINQLLVYNAGTNALITTYDHSNTPALPSGFVARAIYFDAKKRGWIGLANGGVMVYDERQQWHHINFDTIFPPGTQVNFNAITGNKFGDVYIGTNAGLVFFDPGLGEIDRIDGQQYYKLYKKENGLPSNIINAIAYDEVRFNVWIASDQGIVKWDPLCIGNSCNLSRTNRNEAATVASGNWSNPAIWSGGVIPDSSTLVIINDTITVDIDAHCLALSVAPSGKLQINAGKNLTVYDNGPQIIFGRQRRKSIEKKP